MAPRSVQPFWQGPWLCPTDKTDIHTVRLTILHLKILRPHLCTLCTWCELIQSISQWIKTFTVHKAIKHKAQIWSMNSHWVAGDTEFIYRIFIHLLLHQSTNWVNGSGCMHGIKMLTLQRFVRKRRLPHRYSFRQRKSTLQCMAVFAIPTLHKMISTGLHFFLTTVHKFVTTSCPPRSFPQLPVAVWPRRPVGSTSSMGFRA